jgi:hypothetical protein
MRRTSGVAVGGAVPGGGVYANGGVSGTRLATTEGTLSLVAGGAVRPTSARTAGVVAMLGTAPS